MKCRVSLLCLALLVSGCTKKTNALPPGTAQADQFLFERGTALLKDLKWLQSREFLRQIVENYPQSPYRPDAKLAVTTALWHFARGSAHSARGDIEEVEAEHRAFRKVRASIPKDAKYSEWNSVDDVLKVAGLVLSARMAVARGDDKGAIRLFEEAVLPFAQAALDRGVESGRFVVRDAELELVGIVGSTLAVMNGILDGRLAPDSDTIHAERLSAMELTSARTRLPPMEGGVVSMVPMNETDTDASTNIMMFVMMSR